MKYIKTDLPKESLLFPDHSKYDYRDSFQYTLNVSPGQMDMLDIGRAFSQPGPEWFKRLFDFRNRIARLFHLKTPDTDNKTQPEDYQFEIGKRTGIFTLYAKTAQELILGEDDKHLDVRISLFMHHSMEESSETVITVSTVVKINNRLGKVYFFFVKPIHRMFIPTIMRSNFEKLEFSTQKSNTIS